MILADDLAYSDLSCYGDELATPQLDRLADMGPQFTSFRESCKCEPTWALLMNGQYWQDCGLGVKQELTTGQARQPAGYKTVTSGKWHLAGNSLERGFDATVGKKSVSLLPHSPP